LYNSNCNKNQTLANCVDIPSKRGEKHILSFHDYPKVICGFRVKDYSFRNKYLKDKKCRDPSNEKLCGSGKNSFCVPNVLDCPIVSVDLNNIVDGVSGSGLTF
jgi:hypothetical protein